jgi:hypothetical protein
LISLIIGFFIWMKRGRKYRMPVVWLIYVLLFLLLIKVDLPFIDKDLFLVNLPFLLSITLGVALFTVSFGWPNQIILSSNFKRTYAAITAAIVIAAGILWQWSLFFEQVPITRNSESIITAYQKAFDKLLPYSFAVIDQESNMALSRHEHYFIDYNEFTTSYLTLDSVAFAHQGDKNFFDKNPAYLLPPSILVFDYSNPARKSVGQALQNTLSTLNARGREIKIFYKERDITVYEVVNVPGGSYLNELL